MTAVGVIPARYASTRLPGKALLPIAGKPMIEHVYRRASEARSLSRVLVACDDERIRAAVEAFGGEAVMTRPDHPSGTDRIAEAVRDTEADVVVNIQGDEPLIDPEDIDLAVRPLAEDPSCPMSTLITPIREARDLADPSCVKAVVDLKGWALYFSRSLVPYPRAAEAIAEQPIYRHIGLYAYRKDFLLLYATLPSTPLQRAESLEQLRVLEHGYRIRCVETPRESIGVDTEEDLARVRMLMESSRNTTTGESP
jgi:3-deoxy-manno-octulosonate cytidylyltransferase (CMP-KDO synthetase)